jgi:beta-lactamase superfamily II metal-dependent hydrolase
VIPEGHDIVFEIDLIPVSSSSESGGKKSGDAIAVRFTAPDDTGEKVIVIDAGYETHGHYMVKHIRDYYGENVRVDLVISTHPDRDHLGGLAVVIEELDVVELLIHQPRLHAVGVEGFGNLSGIDKVLEVARRRGTKITSPFTGLTRFGEALRVLGPTRAYYNQLVDEHLQDQALAENKSVTAGATVSLADISPMIGAALARALAYLPLETLTDEDNDTGPRNNSSVITLLQVDGQSLLFTGDAGIPALEAAADYHEDVIGSFQLHPLAFMQAPHHGAQRNVGPTILDRLLGPAGRPHTNTTSFVSAAKDDPHHPNPKATNALKRRGCDVAATHGNSINLHSPDAPTRWNWGPIQLLPAFEENGDDDA